MIKSRQARHIFAQAKSKMYTFSSVDLFHEKLYLYINYSLIYLSTNRIFIFVYVKQSKYVDNERADLIHIFIQLWQKHERVSPMSRCMN